jgi:2-methylisocitrate lyase-like PEP mutase family enzyme
MPLSLRDLHRDHQPLVCPLAHDALSARMIERAGFKTFNVGGSALLAARFALPDLGIAALGEMMAGLRDIVEATSLPCLVDADDGYGDVKGVTRTIQSYEAIGIAGCLLEDQAREGKLPGATTARAVIPLDVMEQKLRAAQAARRDKDFVIIGRTDALGLEGLDGAIKRAERFLTSGADGVFVAGLKTAEQYERVGKAFKGAWNCAAIFEGGTTPWLSPRELHAMGFSQIAYPNILMGRMAKALDTGLDRLRRLAQGDAAAFKDAAGELALDALGDAVRLKQWNEIEAKFTRKP